jgi:hypothetical protein
VEGKDFNMLLKSADMPSDGALFKVISPPKEVNFRRSAANGRTNA